MASALNNLKRVYMPLSKETKPTNNFTLEMHWKSERKWLSVVKIESQQDWHKQDDYVYDINTVLIILLKQYWNAIIFHLTSFSLH